MDRAPRALPDNRYYAPGEERAERVHRLFARIARRYDRINDLMSWGMHRRWKRRLVSLAAPVNGEKALDLCCGTGDVARCLAAWPKSGRCEVTGLDFTEEMLDLARKITPASLAVRFIQGDALQLPFDDSAFEIITCAYGLRNLADLDRGFSEAFRVLKPGGRLASLEFGQPRHPLLRTVYLAYLRVALPVFGRIFFRDPDTYGYIFASVTRFPGQQDLAARMKAAGFESVRVHDLLGGVMGICVARKGGGWDR